MPEYIELNALDCADRDVPQAYWDGKTQMNRIAWPCGWSLNMGTRITPPD
ncbi:MAG: hypothetical protein R3C05_15390 [Pirellulaceae bacterium]